MIYILEKEELETIVTEALSQHYGRIIIVSDNEAQEYLETFGDYPHDWEYAVQEDELRTILRDAMQHVGVPQDRLETEYLGYVDTLRTY